MLFDSWIQLGLKRSLSLCWSWLSILFADNSFYSCGMEDLYMVERFAWFSLFDTPSVPFYSAYRFLTFVSEYKVVA
jgi:hypothetical protein